LGADVANPLTVPEALQLVPANGSKTDGRGEVTRPPGAAILA
jgi:hypothetical protein